MADVGIGLVLQPDPTYLDRLGALFEEADYFQIAPETTWREDASGALVPNGYARAFRDIAGDKPFVAHGVGFSVGTFSTKDDARKQRWLERLRRDHQMYNFRWYTDHLGVTSLDGQALTLPLPLPMTPASVARVRASLDALSTIVPTVGVENSAFYFLYGDALDEPAFLRAIAGDDRHLLLDLHNVHTMAENFGFDAERYVDLLPLERVVEIHLAGGRKSDPQWLASGRSFVLDGHDDAVPERVWQLFERVLPRCTNVRGVTLERMEGTVAARDVRDIESEFDRVRKTVGRLAA